MNSSELQRFLTKYPYAVEIGADGRAYLKRRRDGSCAFQIGRLCGIQHEKPLACKLWPFYIYPKPLDVGRPEDAAYLYGNEVYYVYVHAVCNGLGVGPPIEFAIAEAMKIREGKMLRQKFLTSPSTPTSPIDVVRQQVLPRPIC